MKRNTIVFLMCILFMGCKNEPSNKSIEKNIGYSKFKEPFRSQYHFTPERGWMNDPNGLVYNNGVYHLFYQYYPHATVWGPMHWGHATSTDLTRWEHKPVALYPDENGLIFSGSAVVDKYNTSGFGSNGQVPMVAVYTYHFMQGEKIGRDDFQTQGIAFSLDNGETWTKYAGNPVIGNKGTRDLRDPKVFWHEATKSWIMTLVAGNHVKFYRSQNLKDWGNISDFGIDQGAHGGVWECPDLFPLKVEGSDKEKWVLIISIGNGGPNGGSGTQYFVGDFDGTTFTSDQKEYKWLDWGTDNYAGVTYNQVPNGDRIFIGWMSNWQYALTTPSSNWRSAMTLPRKLTLKKYGNEYLLHNNPVSSIASLFENGTNQNIELKPSEKHSVELKVSNQANISFTMPNADVKLTFSNESEEKLALIYDKASNLLMLDRTQSGLTSFNYEFGNKLHYMVMTQLKDNFDMTLYLDKSSIETFVNQGQYAMTQQIFPIEPYTKLTFENLSNDEISIKDLIINPIKSIW